MSVRPMPAAFIGHGGPKITLVSNPVTDAWRAFSASIPRPRAIVVVSAHWIINASAVTAAARPRTIHDFFYGPDDLYAFEYDCPGDPALVQQMIDLVRPTWLGPDVDSWGLDHGAWSVLAHLYPEADIPVVQLSVNGSMPFQYHVDLGAQLAPLREDGVLVLGSGNIVHNGHVMSEEGRAAGEFERAAQFNADVTELMTTLPANAAKLGEHSDFKIGAPTDDHFVPLLYLAGLAAAADEPAEILIDGPALGSPGMTAFAIGRAT